MANGAAQLHSERPDPLSDAQRQGMVSFMESLFTAQIFDDAARDLTARDALGGPENLASLSPRGAPGFSLYDTWQVSPGADPSTEAERRAVEHGQEIFDTRPIRITGVAGLGGDVVGTCSTRHSVPNFGNRAVFGTLNIGIADAAHRTADLPLYTFRNKTTGEVVQSSDPGRALVTGSWADMNTFKVPGLRGLAARAPYFHDGMAATLEDVVEFYDARFEMGLDGQDEEDLIHFLETL